MRIDHIMYKENLPPALRKYWGYQFSTGTRPGPDYLAFQASYGRWLKKLFPDCKVDMHKNHYEFSAVITKSEEGKPDRHVYMSISDVRFWDREWAYNILIRTMKHATDWTGGTNEYCQIDQLRERVEALFDRMKREAA